MHALLFASTFVTCVFLELGDETQLATSTLASQSAVFRLPVFTGAALALVAYAAIGVLTGATVMHAVPARPRCVGGALFVALGLVYLLRS